MAESGEVYSKAGQGAGKILSARARMWARGHGGWGNDFVFHLDSPLAARP